MIEASGEEGEVEEERETAVPAECPAHKATKAKGIMTDTEVFANSIGFLGAGNETTAATLSFGSYLLALNPDIQEKLQSEIDAYFEDKPVRHACTIQSNNIIMCQLQESTLYTAAQEITYLDNVVQESLRLYPPLVA